MNEQMDGTDSSEGTEFATSVAAIKKSEEEIADIPVIRDWSKAMSLGAYLARHRCGKAEEPAKVQSSEGHL